MDTIQYIDSFPKPWGPLAVERLVHIASVADDLETKQKALDTARKYLREQTRNVAKYKDICQRLADLELPVDVDLQWAEETRAENNRIVDAVESGNESALPVADGQTLNGAHAAFLLDIGDLDGAVRRFGFQSAAAAPAGRWTSAARQCEVLLLKRDYTGAGNVAARVLKLPGAPESAVVALRAVQAVVELHRKDWARAAGALLELPADVSTLRGSLGDLVRVEDLGMYAGLCALASFSRQNLHVLANKDPVFAAFTAASGPNAFASRAVDAFLRLGFAEASTIINDSRWTLRRDMHLGPVLDDLLSHIADRARVDYLRAHARASLPQMAAVFGVDTPTLIHDLIRLVSSKSLNLQIDTEAAVAWLALPDSATDTVSRARHLADSFERDAHARLWAIEASKLSGSGSRKRRLQRAM